MSQLTSLLHRFWQQSIFKRRLDLIVSISRYLLIALIMILGAGRVYLHTGFPYTHDGENHLARFANYKVAVKEGQLPPRLAPNLLNHYTYPVFNYNYPLANMLSLPAAFLKLNYELIFKFLALSSLVGLGIGAEFWLKSLGYSAKSRSIAVLTLGSTPFLLNTVWFRGNIGELMALALFVWGLWLTERVTTSQTLSSKWWLWSLAGLAGGILLAHNVAALFLLPLLLAYGWWRAHQWSIRWQIAASWGWAILVSLWFWLPALAEKSLIVLDKARFFQEYSSHFVTLEELLWAPLGFGFSYPGSIDGLSFGLGFSVVVILALSLVLLVSHCVAAVRNSALRQALNIRALLAQPVIVLTLVSVGLIWLQTGSSWPFWQLIQPLSYIQFPWRFALPVTILILPLVTSWWQLVHTQQLHWVKWLLLFAVAVSWWPVLHLKAADYFHRTNVDYEAFSQTTSTLNENLPTQFTYTQIGDWQPTPQLLSGEGQIEMQLWRGSYRKYRLQLTSPATIVEPSIQFAGFETRANQQLVTYIDSPTIQGRLAYELPPGEYLVETRFTQNTWPRQVGNTVSLLALLSGLGGAGWTILSQRKKVAKSV